MVPEHWLETTDLENSVVYFDQQMYACACVQKHTFSSCVREAKVRLFRIIWDNLEQLRNG